MYQHTSVLPEYMLLNNVHIEEYDIWAQKHLSRAKRLNDEAYDQSCVDYEYQESAQALNDIYECTRQKSRWLINGSRIL